MESTLTKKVFKFWFAWNTDKIEKWLGNQAAEGWILEKTSFLMLNFHFRKSEPAKIRYHFEYRNNCRKNSSSFHESASWNLIGEKCGWNLWNRMVKNNTDKSIDTQRLQLKTLKNFLPILIAIGASQPLFLFNSIHRFSDSIEPFSITMLCIVATSTSLFTLGIISMLLKINRLKKEIGA